MSRNRLFVIMIVLLLFLVSCTPAKTSQPKVLFILEEKSGNLNFVLKHEVGVMATLIEQAGYKVVYASASGKPLGSGDSTLTPDLKLSEVNVKDYVGFILPCMALGADRLDDPDADKILTAAQAAGKPIAAASGAIFTLQYAGVLDGKKFGAFKKDAEGIKIGTYMGTDIVQDGNLITSAFCPLAESIGLGKDQTSELIQKFVVALNSAS